jgi:hypothetical protein
MQQTCVEAALVLWNLCFFLGQIFAPEWPQKKKTTVQIVQMTFLYFLKQQKYKSHQIEGKKKSHVVIFKLTMSSYWLPEPGRIIC